MKKRVVKLNQKALRGLIKEAIQDQRPKGMRGRVDLSLLYKELDMTISDELFDAFYNDLYKLQQKAHRLFVRELFKATQRYGMGWTSMDEVNELLDHSDNEDVLDALTKFYDDVQNAIDEYGKKLAKALINVAMPEGEEKE